ncbi:MAG: hypothetical protein IPO08_22825 [Xanthomonadales bacterium]|nr:hypothetical protein [Xanthomonadales bacterium]
MIYTDPAELRHPDMRAILAAALETGDAQLLPNLEALTDADYLLTLPGVVLEDWQACDQRAQLKQLLESNRGLLVQRKTGTDWPSSMRKFSDVQLRMQMETGAPPVAVAVGDYQLLADGHLSVNDRPTGFYWAAYIGSVVAWAARGGWAFQMKTHGDFWQLLQHLVARLVKSQDTPLVHARRYQELVPQDAATLFETLPGVGPETARKLMDTYGSATLALYWLTDPVEYPAELVSAKVVERVRKWLGCEPVGSAHAGKVGHVPLIDEDKEAFLIVPKWQAQILQKTSVAELWPLYLKTKNS